jgi:hypothetical protein
MTLTSRLTRIGRLAIAPIKGFFALTTRATTPRFNPETEHFWAHVKEVARQDIVRYFEPFINAVKCFREELRQA